MRGITGAGAHIRGEKRRGKEGKGGKKGEKGKGEGKGKGKRKKGEGKGEKMGEEGKKRGEGGREGGKKKRREGKEGKQEQTQNGIPCWTRQACGERKINFDVICLHLQRSSQRLGTAREQLIVGSCCLSAPPDHELNAFVFYICHFSFSRRDTLSTSQIA